MCRVSPLFAVRLTGCVAVVLCLTLRVAHAGPPAVTEDQFDVVIAGGSTAAFAAALSAAEPLRASVHMASLKSSHAMIAGE